MLKVTMTANIPSSVEGVVVLALGDGGPGAEGRAIEPLV